MAIFRVPKTPKQPKTNVKLPANIWVMFDIIDSRCQKVPKLSNWNFKMYDFTKRYNSAALVLLLSRNKTENAFQC